MQQMRVTKSWKASESLVTNAAVTSRAEMGIT